MIRKWLRSPSGEGLAFATGVGVAQVATATFYVLAAREVGPSQFGIAAASLAMATWITTLADFGNASYVLREVAAGRMIKTKIFGRLFPRAGILGLGVVALLITSSVVDNWLPSLLGLIAFARLVNLTLSSGLRALGSAGSIITISIAEPLVALATLSAAGSDAGASRVMVAVLAGASTSAAIYGVLLRRRIGSWGSSPDASWRDAADFGVFGIAVGAADLDVVLVSARVSVVTAGHYSAVSRWTRPVTLLTQSFMYMAVPRIAAATSSTMAWKAVKPAAWILAVGMLICVAMAFYSPQLVDLFLGTEYHGSATALAVLSIAAAVGVPVQFLAVFLINRGHARAISRIQVVSTAVQLALVVPLSLQYGATGPGIAILASRIMALALMSAVPRAMPNPVKGRRRLRRGLSLIAFRRLTDPRSMRGPTSGLSPIGDWGEQEQGHETAAPALESHENADRESQQTVTLCRFRQSRPR